jgi:hypothetical protein
MKLNTLGRFKMPFSSLRNERREDEEYAKRLVGSAVRVFGSAEGEFLMKHLIEEYGLDAQVGVKSLEEGNYIAGQQDVVRYILSLTATD